MQSRLAQHGRAYVFTLVYSSRKGGHAVLSKVTLGDAGVMWRVHDPNGTSWNYLKRAVHVGLKPMLTSLKIQLDADAYRIKFASLSRHNLEPRDFNSLRNRVHPIVLPPNYNRAICAFVTTALLFDDICVDRDDNMWSLKRRLHELAGFNERTSAAERNLLYYAFIMSIFSEIVRRYVPDLYERHTHTFSVTSLNTLPYNGRRWSV